MRSYPSWIQRDVSRIRKSSYTDLEEHLQLKKDIFHFLYKTKSFENFAQNILFTPIFKNFLSSHLIIHEKGKSFAKSFNYGHQNGGTTHQVEAATFNRIFNFIKKSKSKFYQGQKDIFFQKIGLIGTFLAKDISFENSNIILIVSRNDFLKPCQEEIDHFQIVTNLFPFFINYLKTDTFIQKKTQLIKLLLKSYPAYIRIYNYFGETLFENAPFLSKEAAKSQYKISESATLEIFRKKDHCEESYDFFHMQRIKLLGDLLNTLQHEICNPLFGLKLATTTLELDQFKSDELELIKQIEQNVDKCLSILNGFISLFNNSSPTQAVDLKKIVKESITLAKSELQGVRLKYQEPEGPSYINVKNTTWIIQVIFNLLVNSAQALRGKQQSCSNVISVYYKVTPSHYIIAVEDNGPGIPPEQREKIFSPFFTTKKNGTGLGLAISKSLSKQMGGDLNLVKCHCGSSFELKIPIGMDQYEHSHY